ncbi:thioredoxin, mitochondrial isoform X1 [Physeter macrocephalus]|uniref:Thioredoxin, mitochondrial isoform X1 n=1 Tax=Physeter macrocephalus TaxID=9755 RepID=A0A9W2WGY3_PHYMC|nr:thioredoxin, mitochondrial isoform X1 [Physeter catodon]
MAQRLLLRRFLASVICRKPSQNRWAPLASRALQTPQRSPNNLTVTPSQARSIYTTRVCTTTFNIQDGPDFQDRVVNSETPVVVDFHAQWCGPCKILGPRLEKVVAKQHGKVVMAKVDIDDHTDLAIEYEVWLPRVTHGQDSTQDTRRTGVSCAHRAGHQEWRRGGQVCGHQG